MGILFAEVCDELKKLDEITLLEVLDITSEDIVDRFSDKIEDNYDKLAEEFTTYTEEEEDPF